MHFRMYLPFYNKKLGNDIPVGTGFTMLTFHRVPNDIALTVLEPACRRVSKSLNY